MPPASFLRERLIDHLRIKQEEDVDMMMRHLGVYPTKVAHEAHDTKGANAIFDFLEKIYKSHLQGDRMCKVMTCRFSTTDIMH